MVGIRINGDDDNENETADRWESHAVAGENDLIEVVILRDPSCTLPRLRRSSEDIMVWTTRNKGRSIAFSSENGLETDILSFGYGASEMTVWVEWVGMDHGTADLSILESTSSLVLDKVKFHTFHSIVIALGGENQVPTDPPDANHGTFQIAVELYRRGYDVWMYDEDNVRADGHGEVYNEIERAVQRRGVTQIAIFGYSHGGGSTFSLAQLLHDNRAELGNFTIPFTSYVDAVENDSDVDIQQETRRPLDSQYHINQYQNGTIGDGWLDGGPIDNPPGANWELDVETTVWGVNATHYTVDDFDQVRTEITTRLQPRIHR